MMKYKYPLATTTWDQCEYIAISKVIASGMFTMGEHVAGYEKSMADYLGCKYAVMVNSGSSANLLMIAALMYTKNDAIKLSAGDEVIVPAVSWPTTYYPLYQYGLKIKFVDIDLSTLNYDLNQLRSAITDKTRMVMAVNLLGNCNDYDQIREMLDGKKIFLIEDNCESLGAEFDGKKAGTFGVMGSYSSFFSHHISTMEGGLISTDDEELYHILLSLRAHGWTRNLPKHNRVCSEKSDDPFKESFRFVLPGYNVRPIELSGAIGVEQVKKLPQLISDRRLNGDYLKSKMANHPSIMIQDEVGSSSWFGFSLLVRPGSGLTRDELLIRLKDLGFECRPIVAGNFTKNEVVKYFNYEVHGDLRNAEYVDDNGLFVGNHHYPIHDAIDELSKI